MTAFFLHKYRPEDSKPALGLSPVLNIDAPGVGCREYHYVQSTLKYCFFYSFLTRYKRTRPRSWLCLTACGYSAAKHSGRNRTIFSDFNFRTFEVGHSILTAINMIIVTYRRFRICVSSLTNVLAHTVFNILVFVSWASRKADKQRSLCFFNA